MQIQKDKVNTLVIVPLYPQYSISTSGSSLKLLEEIFYRERDVWGPNAGTSLLFAFVTAVDGIASAVRAQGESHGGAGLVLQTGLREGHGQAHH